MRLRLRRWLRLSLARLAVLLLVALVAGLAAWYVRDTRHALHRQQHEIRADCAFKRDIARLPGQVATAGPALLLLAHDARMAYIDKGCAVDLGPAPRPYPTVASPAGLR
jgi:hypothetical protein